MKPLYHGTIYEFDEIDVSAGKSAQTVLFQNAGGSKDLKL